MQFEGRPSKTHHILCAGASFKAEGKKKKKPFNLFSTSIAVFKGVSWQNVKSNPFLMQHVAFILLYKITPSRIRIYKLSLFYSIHGWRNPQLERRGCLVGKRRGGGGGGRLVKKAAGFCY